MKIVIGNDHGGVELKNQIIERLKSKHDFINCGTDTIDSVDYPDYAIDVCNKVLSEKADLGILICKSGIGMSIVANKVNGIRAALIKDSSEAILAHKHNKANVLVFGANYVNVDNAVECIEKYFETTFEERHQRRIYIIDEYEKTR